ATPAPAARPAAAHAAPAAADEDDADRHSLIAEPPSPDEQIWLARLSEAPKPGGPAGPEGTR
ncbi:MAG: hypothetical protein HY908_05165, partial [Myxococcales bacterium]|nr:hypothetical protein [Myxococcales bacterium]